MQKIPLLERLTNWLSDKLIKLDKKNFEVLKKDYENLKKELAKSLKKDTNNITIQDFWDSKDEKICSKFQKFSQGLAKQKEILGKALDNVTSIKDFNRFKQQLKILQEIMPFIKEECFFPIDYKDNKKQEILNKFINKGLNSENEQAMIAAKQEFKKAKWDYSTLIKHYSKSETYLKNEFISEETLKFYQDNRITFEKLLTNAGIAVKEDQKGQDSDPNTWTYSDDEAINPNLARLAKKIIELEGNKELLDELVEKFNQYDPYDKSLDYDVILKWRQKETCDSLAENPDPNLLPLQKLEMNNGGLCSLITTEIINLNLLSKEEIEINNYLTKLNTNESFKRLTDLVPTHPLSFKEYSWKEFFSFLGKLFELIAFKFQKKLSYELVQNKDLNSLKVSDEKTPQKGPELFDKEKRKESMEKVLKNLKNDSYLEILLEDRKKAFAGHIIVLYKDSKGSFKIFDSNYGLSPLMNLNQTLDAFTGKEALKSKLVFFDHEKRLKSHKELLALHKKEYENQEISKKDLGNKNTTESEISNTKRKHADSLEISRNNSNSVVGISH